MKVIYVAGKYRGKTLYETMNNINAASKLAAEVWQAGAVALCPHKNSALFDGIVPDSVFLAGDIELLKRCDGLIAVDNWRDSRGAEAEVAYAVARVIPIFHRIGDLVLWLAKK
jgi:nucleoside 2-deoxyribosyltransferase